MDVGSHLSWQGLKRKGSVHRRARPSMKMYEAVYTGRECTLRVQNFFILFFKLTNQRRPKVTCVVRH